MIRWETLKTSEERKSEELIELSFQARAERDSRLAKIDFYLLPDAPQQPEGLLAYRQALRDITKQTGFPENIQWPSM